MYTSIHTYTSVYIYIYTHKYMHIYHIYGISDFPTCSRCFTASILDILPCCYDTSLNPLLLLSIP